MSAWQNFALAGINISLQDAENFNKENGAQAWAAMRPAPPDFSSARELYELRDIPGSLKQALGLFRHNMRGNRSSMSYTGEWYLALQFGWAPLFGSVLDFVHTFRRRKKIFDQLLRDEGKWVHRSRNLGNQNSDFTNSFGSDDLSALGNPYMYPKHVQQCYGAGAGTWVRQTFKRRTWCTGMFKYFLPSGPRDRDWENRLYRRIFGFRLTPSQVYAVIPWSWFVDYFAELKSFLDAVSPGVEDRLICKYAYVMTHYTWTHTVDAWQTVYSSASSSGPKKRVTSSVTWTREYKTRAKATVLGFGLKDGDLSPFQGSIIGALGLSKLS
jgi:hypothetical protein